MISVKKNGIKMQGSGYKDSVVTVSASSYVGRTYQETFTIKVNDLLYETITVTRNSKSTFDFYLILNSEESYQLLDSNNNELLDSNNNELYSKDFNQISDNKYSIIKTSEISQYYSSNFYGWNINIYSVNDVLLGSGTTDVKGVCYISNVDFINNLNIKVVITKGSIEKRITLPINYIDDAYIVYNSPLPYDAEIEYLETNGSAYIDTGIAPADITPILETRVYLPTSSSNKYVIGSDGNGNKSFFSIGRLTSNGINFRIGNNYKSFNGYAANWYVIKLNGSNGQASLDGVVKWTSSSLTFHTRPILLFTSYGGSSPRSSFVIGMRISYYKLWNGNTLIQDMIPVRIGSIGYMYDKVSKQLFGNAGTGNFILGNDI